MDLAQVVQGLGGLWVVIGSSPHGEKNLPIEKKKKKKAWKKKNILKVTYQIILINLLPVTNLFLFSFGNTQGLGSSVYYIYKH